MKRIILLAAALLIATISTVLADNLRPIYVEIQEIEGSQYRLQIKVPAQVQASNQPVVIWPDFCHLIEMRRFSRMISPVYQCQRDLAGASMHIDYPNSTPPASGVVKVFFRSGESHTLLLANGETRWQMPIRESTSQVAKDYAWLGFYHILAGTDHLLFLLCLLWIAGSFGRIAITITGFTLAHSVTLVLSALNLVRLPVPPIEAVIALSVLFLATEVVKGWRENLTWQYPVCVSASFGLLHGLGFAAVLGEIGLPQTELITGLVFFNVGVEIGQLLFATAVLISVHGLRRVSEKFTSVETLQRHLQVAMGYTVGITAAYWCIDRTVSFVF